MMLGKVAGSAANGLLFQRIGAVSGALAVGLGAYGAHVFVKRPEAAAYAEVFHTASRYHFFHSIVLLTMPLLKNPAIPGTLLTLGMTLFSGTPMLNLTEIAWIWIYFFTCLIACYVVALTENRRYNKPAPIGGLLLIAGWLAMLA